MHKKLVSTSCELYRILANTNPHLLVKCKQLLYDMVEADPSFSAMVGLILSQIALSIKVEFALLPPCSLH